MYDTLDFYFYYTSEVKFVLLLFHYIYLDAICTSYLEDLDFYTQNIFKVGFPSHKCCFEHILLVYF